MNTQRINELAKSLLKSAQSKIEDPINYCRNEYARDKYGRACTYDSAIPTQWCALGAFYSAVEEAGDIVKGMPEHAAYRALYAASFELYDEGVVAANDKLGHSAIMSVYEKAISSFARI